MTGRPSVAVMMAPLERSRRRRRPELSQQAFRQRARRRNRRDGTFLIFFGTLFPVKHSGEAAWRSCRSAPRDPSSARRPPAPPPPPRRCPRAATPAASAARSSPLLPSLPARCPRPSRKDVATRCERVEVFDCFPDDLAVQLDSCCHNVASLVGLDLHITRLRGAGAALIVETRCARGRRAAGRRVFYSSSCGRCRP